MKKIGCIVMASGHSRRYGKNKLLETIDGMPMAARAWKCVKGTESDTVVVTRFPEIARLAQKEGFACLQHADPLQSGTIRLGLAYGIERGWEGCLFLSGDQPLVTMESIRRLCTCFGAAPDKVHRLSWDGKQQKPVLFPARFFPALQALKGDVGGSAVLRGLETEAVEAGYAWELWDVDEPADLDRIQAYLRSPASGLPELLQIPRGMTAVIGSGGKTTLLRTLARQLDGTVILCTSTHIFPFEEWPFAADAAQIRQALAHSRAVCTGTPAENGKLTAPPLSFADLKNLADYVLVEADGSARHPLKAHAPWEPVIPEGTDLVLGVAGASGFLGPISETVHRPDIFCRRAGEGRTVLPEEPAAPELTARVLHREALTDVWILNQADAVPEELIRRFTAAMCEPVQVLSLGRISGAAG